MAAVPPALPGPPPGVIANLQWTAQNAPGAPGTPRSFDVVLAGTAPQAVNRPPAAPADQLWMGDPNVAGLGITRCDDQARHLGGPGVAMQSCADPVNHPPPAPPVVPNAYPPLQVPPPTRRGIENPLTVVLAFPLPM